MNRRDFTAASLGFFLGGPSRTTYSFWVFRLLKPRVLHVHPAGSSRLYCQSPQGNTILEGSQSLRVDSSITPFHAQGPDGTAAPFLLEIPGLMRRVYRGTLEIRSKAMELIPVVSLAREVAVGSIVGAELPTAAAPMAALSAQAIVARSFLTASAPRHSESMFCDTTHCQFLRSAPPTGSLVAKSVRSTNDLVLASSAGFFPASYSAACGGHTDGATRDGYRYRSVNCRVCREKHFARRGHGFGLCQEGAIGLAKAGWTWRQILREYFPGTVIRTQSS